MTEPVTRDKKEKSTKIPLVYGGFDAGKEIADELIRTVHSELGQANIAFVCRNIAKKKNKKLVPGNVYKVNAMYKYLTRKSDMEDDGYHFVIEIALEVWNDMGPNQRRALIDHLLTRIVYEENETTGEAKYSIRTPDIQEFAEVAERHHAWHEGLVEFEKCLRVPTR